MRLIRILTLSITLLAVASVFVNCGGHAQAQDQEGKEYTSAYICPMHCAGSGSDEMGQCPVCGMDYEPNEEQGESEQLH